MAPQADSCSGCEELRGFGEDGRPKLRDVLIVLVGELQLGRLLLFAAVLIWPESTFWVRSSRYSSHHQPEQPAVS